MDGTTITLSVLGTIAGALGSTWWINRRKEQKEKEIRKIAISGLNVFLKYANGVNTYEEAKNDFNTSLNITEKRIVLVCFHKIGVPIRFSSDKVFQVKNIEFESNVIDKNEISSMMLQVEKGNCDRLFFLDLDTYFSENSRIKFLRSLGVKFVSEVFSKSKWNSEKILVDLSENWENNFSKGEQNAIWAFKDALVDSYYFCLPNQSPNEVKLKKLIDEIKIGLWDDYLLTNIQNYLNHLYNRQLMQNLTTNQNKTITEDPNSK
jgi:hypothetical protein